MCGGCVLLPHTLLILSGRHILYSRAADGSLASRSVLLWTNLFQPLLHHLKTVVIFWGISDHDEDEFYYTDEMQIR